MNVSRTFFLSLLLAVSLISFSGCRQVDGASTFAPADPAVVVTDGLGVNIHFTEARSGELKMLSDAGFRWVRMDFKWDETEKTRGVYDFSAYDGLVQELDEYSVHALFILDYGNPLYDGGAPPRTEETRQAFARWAVASANHFSGHGVIWEVYNEPNNPAFWPPKTNPTEYMMLARTVGKAFREAAPDEKLAGPAVGEMDFSFLEACFKSGLLEYVSAVTVHPYLRGDPENVAAGYSHLRDLIARYHAGSNADIQIYSGEWGYSDVWRGMSEARQAEMLAREFLTNAANEIPLSIWYDWRDDGMDPKEAEHHFGLVRSTYRPGLDQVYEPKPAYLAARTFSTYFNGSQFSKRIAVGDPQDYVLVFTTGSDFRLAVWTTVANPHQIYIPVDQGAYVLTGHTGNSLGKSTADQRGLAVPVSSAPVYVSRQP
jgi:hypothetical protein